MRDLSPDELTDLGAFLADELSPNDAARVKRWIAEHAELQAVMSELAQRRRPMPDGSWQGVSKGELGAHANSMVQRLMAAIAAVPDTTVANRADSAERIPSDVTSHPRAFAPNPKTNPLWLGRGMAWISVGAACLTVGGIYLFSKDLARPSTIIQQQYKTAAGQIALVSLDNNMHVTLGPATAMHVTAREGATHVVVDGQALFMVTPNAHRPFVVRTGRIESRVLGTTFLVQRYHDEHQMSLVVLQGRVAMRDTSATHNGQQVVLTAGTASITPDSGPMVLRDHVVNDDALAWTHGALIFRQTLVRDIAAQLSRAYGVDIRVPDSTLGGQRLTWTVHTARNSLTDVLADLPLVLDVRVQQHNGIVFLIPGRVRIPSVDRSQLTREEIQYGR